MYTNLKNLIPTKFFLKLKYFKKTGRFLRLKNPQTFDEKINYLKIYDDLDIKTELEDKLKAKEFVASKIGEKYIIPTLKVLDVKKPFKEQLNNLNKFILKTNFESGVVYYCENPKDFDFTSVQKNIISSYKDNFHMHGREMHYSRIKKECFAEKLLDQHKKLLDYKFYCFNGQPKYVHVDRNLKSNPTQSFYDMNWQKIKGLYRGYKYDDKSLEIPNNFDEMKFIATELSTNFKFVRVDLYNHLGEILFGEMTFLPASGFQKFSIKKYDYEFGKLIKI